MLAGTKHTDFQERTKHLFLIDEEETEASRMVFHVFLTTNRTEKGGGGEEIGGRKRATLTHAPGGALAVRAVPGPQGSISWNCPPHFTASFYTRQLRATWILDEMSSSDLSDTEKKLFLGRTFLEPALISYMSVRQSAGTVK